MKVKKKLQEKTKVHIKLCDFVRLFTVFIKHRKHILYLELIFLNKKKCYFSSGGMGLAAAQQQLKARNKMHEMAIRQHLITDQVSKLFF